MVGGNIEKTGYAVGDSMTMADICLMAYFSLTMISPIRKEGLAPMLE